MNTATYNLQSFLRDIAPYVIVCGSFARGEETLASDIDCFLRLREDYDPENDADESYMPEVLRIVRAHELEFSSVITGHIAVEEQRGIDRMVEVSWHYKLPSENKPFYRDVCGVRMLCCVDNKDARYDDCYNGDDIARYEKEVCKCQ